MTLIPWNPSVLLPAHLALALVEMRAALDAVHAAVERGDDAQQISIALTRVRDELDELDRLAPAAALQERSWEFPRHLLAAERAARHGEPVDQEDVDELATTDFADLTRRVERGQALPADVAGLRDALAGLEGPAIEFKKSWPEQNRDLAREFAALGPVGGTVYLGVDDDGSVAGLSVDTSKELDQFDLRIRGIAEKSDVPPLALTTTWLASRGRIDVRCAFWHQASRSITSRTC